MFHSFEAAHTIAQTSLKPNSILPRGDQRQRASFAAIRDATLNLVNDRDASAAAAATTHAKDRDPG